MKHVDSVHSKLSQKGKWRVPGLTTHHVVGVLSGSEAEGYFLETSEPLDPKAKEAEKLFGGNGRQNDHQVVYGETRKGKFTLFDVSVFDQSLSLNTQGLDEIKYRCRFVAKGDHFASVESLKFPKVRTQYSVLGSWIDARVFLAKQGDEFGRLDVTFSLPEKHPLYECKNYSIFLEFTYRPPGFCTGQNSLMIEWEPMISIESNGEDIRFDGVEVESYRGIITCLNYFLALVTASPSYQYAVEGVRRNRDLQSKYCWVNPVEIYGNADIFPPKYDQRHRIIARERAYKFSSLFF
jgi:hypothetical protein